jgi:hypothetical protein
LQTPENKVLSWDIIGESAPLLAAITIRKSQGSLSMTPSEPSLTLLREFLATGVLTEEFFLVDVGASNGIAHFWYCFGDKLNNGPAKS